MSDGFYNVFAKVNGIKRFGIILLTLPGQKPLALFFFGLPMGWVSSPLVFCAASETITNRTNKRIQATGDRPFTALTALPTRQPRRCARSPSRIDRRASGRRTRGCSGQ